MIDKSFRIFVNVVHKILFCLGNVLKPEVVSIFPSNKGTKEGKGSDYSDVLSVLSVGVLRIPPMHIATSGRIRMRRVKQFNYWRNL